ncbi:MAG: metalloregulator ArsR/SmtB family transcription factor [Fimbriimonadaceae bacterium]
MNRDPGEGAASEPLQQDALRRFKADVFRVLAHPTRIHIVECLRSGELTVSEILEHVPIEPANASQHLSLLRAKGLVAKRKEGNQVFYSLRDPLLIEVLDIMKRYFKAHLEEAMAMLEGMDD